MERNIDIELVWIPGHKGIPGSDKADAAAKMAAKEKGALDLATFKHPTMKSARIQSIKTAEKTEWATAWTTRVDSSAHLRKICNNPAAGGAKLYAGVKNRQDSATLVRLRTGHCSLNQYLHRFGIKDDPRCQCGSGSVETVRHFLLHCSEYDRLRDELRRKVGAGSMRIDTLLGSPGHVMDTLEYIKKTGKFAF